MASGAPKKTAAPSLPPAIATPQEIGAEAMRAGEEEAARIRRRRGRRETQITAPGFGAPAAVERRELGTTFG